MASKSGDTKETVAAAKYVKEKGATIVSVLGVDNSPLGELSGLFSCIQRRKTTRVCFVYANRKIVGK